MCFYACEAIWTAVYDTGLYKYNRIKLNCQENKRFRKGLHALYDRVTDILYLLLSFFINKEVIWDMWFTLKRHRYLVCILHVWMRPCIDLFISFKKFRCNFSMSSCLHGLWRNEGWLLIRTCNVQRARDAWHFLHTGFFKDNQIRAEVEGTLTRRRTPPANHRARQK